MLKTAWSAWAKFSIITNVKPQTVLKRIIFRWLKVVILIYCLVGLAVYYLQDKILFRPKALPATHQYSFSFPFKEVNIPYNRQSNINILQFPANGDSAKGVILYFHGNKENTGRYAPAAPHFTSQGYDVWMIDYPGFGKSTGTFSEDQLHKWAEVFYTLARARYSPYSIVIYGKSIGTGIAAQLASIRDCKALVLEGPYYSVPSIFSSRLPVYPFDKMIHFKLPTWQYVQKVVNPVIVFHGTSDGTIPYRNAKKLKPFLKPTDEFVTVEGAGHNDLYEFPVVKQKMDSLLNVR
jgi:uncharacterized protein